MAMDLRRCDEQGIMKAMTRVTIREARQECAGARGNHDLDRVDPVGEARDDLVKPVMLGAGALRLGPCPQAKPV